MNAKLVTLRAHKKTSRGLLNSLGQLARRSLKSIVYFFPPLRDGLRHGRLPFLCQ